MNYHGEEGVYCMANLSTMKLKVCSFVEKKESKMREINS